MNPHRLTWGAAFDYEFAQIIGITTLAAIVLRSDSWRIPFNRTVVVWLALVLWMNVTTYYSLVPDDAWVEWDQVMKIQLFAFITLLLMQSRQRINLLIGVIILSIGFYSFKGGIFALLTGSEHRVYGPPGTFIADNNDLGLAALMVLPMMIYVLTQLQSRYQKAIVLGVIGLSILAILTSQSRGAFLAVIATIIFLWWRSRRKMTVAVVIAVLAPVLFFSMPDHWHERMQSITAYEQDGSALGRINAWYYAYNLALDRPLVGGGFQAFDPELFRIYAPEPDRFHDSHSIYFETLGEHGFVGLTLFLLLGIFAFRSASRTIKLTNGIADLYWANVLSGMLQASLIAFAVGGAFLGRAYFDLYYHIVAIIVLLQDHVERQPQSVPESNSSITSREKPVYSAR